MNSKALTAKSDSLYAEGDYFEASIEYERLIFQSENPSDINHYKYRKALCYKRLNRFDDALNELQTIYFSDPADSLYRLATYEQALCFYLNGQAARALWKIDEFFHRSADSVYFENFLPLKILCLNETLKWEEAKNSFFHYIHMQNYTAVKEKALKQMVSNLYGSKSLPHIKSIDKAENLSRFFPGLGQMYAGKTGEGIMNFLINASVLTFAGFQVYNGFYITGYLVGLGFFNKTYHGGIKRAGILTAQKNKEKTMAFRSEVIALILSNMENVK